MHCNTLKELPSTPPDKSGWPWTEESLQLPDTMPNGGSSWPRISIVTPSMNQGQYIEETIRSVLLQRYPNLEYIVIDGGSSDRTIEIIRKYEDYITYWVSEPDNGQAHAINKGLKHATGDIIAWINSDDFYAMNAFENVALFFKEHPDVSMVYGQCNKVDINSEEIGSCPKEEFDINKLICFEWFIPQPSVFLRSNVLNHRRLLNEKLHLVMDTDMWIRIALDGLKIEYAPFLLSFYRMHEETKTKYQRERSYLEKLKIMDRTFKNLKLSKQLTSRKNESYGLCHRELAMIYSIAGNIRNAVIHFLQALFYSEEEALEEIYFNKLRHNLKKHIKYLPDTKYILSFINNILKPKILKKLFRRMVMFYKARILGISSI